MLVEDLFGDRGEGSHRQCGGMVGLRRVVARWGLEVYNRGAASLLRGCCQICG